MPMLYTCKHCQIEQEFHSGKFWKRMELWCDTCGKINQLVKLKNGLVKVIPKETPSEYVVAPQKSL